MALVWRSLAERIGKRPRLLMGVTLLLLVVGCSSGGSRQQTPSRPAIVPTPMGTAATAVPSPLPPKKPDPPQPRQPTVVINVPGPSLPKVTPDPPAPKQPTVVINVPGPSLPKVTQDPPAPKEPPTKVTTPSSTAESTTKRAEQEKQEKQGQQAQQAQQGQLGQSKDAVPEMTPKGVDRSGWPESAPGGKLGSGQLPPNFEPGKGFDPEKPVQIPWLPKGRKGYPAKDGSFYEPTTPGKNDHGGEHWDRQLPDGTHENVFPSGKTR